MRIASSTISISWSIRAREGTAEKLIGRSTGAEVNFTATTGDKLTVFTTRPDTLYGVTYMVLSPEHALLGKWKDQIKNWEEVQAYRKPQRVNPI